MALGQIPEVFLIYKSLPETLFAILMKLTWLRVTIQVEQQQNITINNKNNNNNNNNEQHQYTLKSTCNIHVLGCCYLRVHIPVMSSL